MHSRIVSRPCVSDYVEIVALDCEARQCSWNMDTVLCAVCAVFVLGLSLAVRRGIRWRLVVDGERPAQEKKGR